MIFLPHLPADPFCRPEVIGSEAAMKTRPASQFTDFPTIKTGCEKVYGTRG
jgi:hypothetical protein